GLCLLLTLSCTDCPADPGAGFGLNWRRHHPYKVKRQVGIRPFGQRGIAFVKTFTFALVLPTLLALAGPVSAQSPAQCAAIDDDGARLVCYDELFRNAGGTGDAAA